MYSDPSGELQECLGMTLRTLDPGSQAEKGYVQPTPLSQCIPSLTHGFVSCRDYQQMSMLKNGLVSAAVSPFIHSSAWLKLIRDCPGRMA